MKWFANQQGGAVERFRFGFTFKVVESKFEPSDALGNLLGDTVILSRLRDTEAFVFDLLCFGKQGYCLC